MKIRLPTHTENTENTENTEKTEKAQKYLLLILNTQLNDKTEKTEVSVQLQDIGSVVKKLNVAFYWLDKYVSRVVLIDMIRALFIEVDLHHQIILIGRHVHETGLA